MPSSASFIRPLAFGGVLFLFLLLPPWAHPLQCFQSQQSLTAADVPGNALSCPNSSLSCTKSIDFTMQIIARGCQSSNCAFPNGTNSATLPICFNSSTNAQSYCCCYGDSCNGIADERKNGLMIIALLVNIIVAMFAIL